MTTSFSIQAAAVDADPPWDSDERLRIGGSPSGRRRQRQSSPWSSFASNYRYATNSFVGDLLGKAKITMLQKGHKENFSKTFADFNGDTFLVRDFQNPFILTRYISDRMLQENDEDNFYNAIRVNYSPQKEIHFHPPQLPVPRSVDNRNPNTSKNILAKFYGRQTNTRDSTDLTKLSDHLCFDDGDDKVYNYSLRSSSLLASSAHPLLRPSLLNFRNRRPTVLSKGRSCHRRGSTTSCSTLSSFESFSSFTDIASNDNSPSSVDKRSSSVLGSSLRILLQTNHHQKVAPTSVSSSKQNSTDQVYDDIVLNLDEKMGDIELDEDNDELKTNEQSNTEGKTITEKRATDYNRSEASLDFCLTDQDDVPLSFFQPSVSSTQAESSSGLMFLYDPSVPILEEEA